MGRSGKASGIGSRNNAKSWGVLRSSQSRALAFPLRSYSVSLTRDFHPWSRFNDVPPGLEEEASFTSKTRHNIHLLREERGETELDLGTRPHQFSFRSGPIMILFLTSSVAKFWVFIRGERARASLVHGQH